MRKILAILGTLLLLGCNGGGSETEIFEQTGLPVGQPGLELVGVKHGNSWRVDLVARSVQDLYQLAGSISFPADSYQIVLVESGDGLGGPLDSYFAGAETQPGKIDFASTKRFAGPGVDGDVRIASIKLNPNDEFNIRDFRIINDGKSLVINNSNSLPIELQVAGGAQ